MVGTPLVLTSGVTSAAGRIVGVDDPLALQCPGNGAMLIEAVSFAFNHFTAHEVMMQVGRAKITNGYQPITSILPAMEDRLWGSFDQSRPSNASTWRFDQPLFCPPATRMSFMFRIAQDPAQSGVDARLLVAVKGRFLTNYTVPKTVHVPWVTAFRPPGTNSFFPDNSALFRSVIGDVTNHFRTTLHVTRFLGSGVSFNPAVGDYAMDGLMSPTDFDGVFSPAHWAGQCYSGRVQIRDWLGNNLVRDPTLLSHLCQAQRNEWRAKFDLPPSRSLFVTMDERHQMNLDPQGEDDQFWIQPSIAMVGWRQEFFEEVQS